LRDSHDPSEFWRLHCPRLGRILRQREMCSRPVIICGECFYVPVQRRFVEDDYMIEAFAPNGSDYALDVGSVPRGSRCTRHLLYAHVVHLSGEGVAEDSIPISQHIAWCRVPRKSIAKLLGSPFRGRMSRDVEVQYSPPFMGQHKEHVQNLEANGGHGEEVDRDNLLDVLSRNVRQVWLGDFRCRTIYLLTLVSPMSIPSLVILRGCAAHPRVDWHGSWYGSGPELLARQRAFRFFRAGSSKSKTTGSFSDARRGPSGA
jgi:hypothetical protein